MITTAAKFQSRWWQFKARRQEIQEQRMRVRKMVFPEGLPACMMASLQALKPESHVVRLARNIRLRFFAISLILRHPQDAGKVLAAWQNLQRQRRGLAGKIPGYVPIYTFRQPTATAALASSGNSNQSGQGGNP